MSFYILSPLPTTAGGTGTVVAPTAGQVPIGNANGTYTPGTIGGGGTPGGSTTQFQYNNAGAFAGSANLVYDGTNVQVNNQASMRFSNATTNYLGFRAPAVVPSNVTWTLPSTDGTANQTLITNGSGVLSWATPTLTPVAPTNVAVPVVTGTATVGQTLSSTTGTWNGYPTPTFAYQWVRGAATNISGATSSTYQLQDADYNNTVKCTVTATNSAGSASATSAATATIAAGVPGAPTIGTATAGNAQASVAFTAPAITGGVAITSFTATSSPGGITGSAASSPITVSGLTNGTAYTFTVTATNSVGTGAASAASNSVTPSAAPVTDASFAYVPLLLETTSTNGQQNNTFLDSSTNNFTITRNGTPTQGSITPYWSNGQWSNYFVSVNTIYNASISSMNFGASTDFTIEAWVNWPAAAGANQTFFELTGTTRMILGRTTTGFRAYWNGTEKGSAYTFALGTWYHIAVVRNSGTVSFYINGSLLTSFADTVTWTGINRFNIGSNSNDFEPMTGYVSNLRVVNGTAVYTSAFTPPTSPLTAITNTQLLTCQSNRFQDNSTNNYTLSFVGTPRVQAFQPFSPAAAYTTALYGGSGYFDGSSQLSIPNNAAFEIGAGNFSYEAFVYATIATSTFGQGIIAYGIVGSSGSSVCNLYISDDGFFRLLYASVEITLSDPASFPVNQWVHCVACRSGSTLSLFINGVRKATTTTSATVGTGGSMSIGGQFFAVASTRQLQNGYISSARVLKGASAYDATLTTLTVPTAPLTAIANTSLLLNMTNAGIYDASTQNNVITVGDAQASTTQYKWSPSSMKFDGTGDYLTMPLTPATTITSGNFTIEFWLNPSTVASASQAIVGTRESDSAASINWGIFLSSNQLSFQCYSNASALMVSFSHQTTLSAGTWYYCALTRNSSTFTLYINSVASTSTPTSAATIGQSGTTLYVGKFAAATSVGALNGYIQDLRITKGVARTIATPTAAFPVQ